MKGENLAFLAQVTTLATGVQLNLGATRGPWGSAQGAKCPHRPMVFRHFS